MDSGLEQFPMALAFPVAVQRDGFHYLRDRAPPFLRSLLDIKAGVDASGVDAW